METIVKELLKNSVAVLSLAASAITIEVFRNRANQGNKVLNEIDTGVTVLRTYLDSIKRESVDNVNSEILSSKMEDVSKNIYSFKENIIDKISDVFFGNGTNITCAYVDKISDIYNAYRDFLSTLTTAQVGSLAHILICIVISISLFSLTSVFLGDTLIRYLNLEAKYPKLARFIQIRRKFQIYYFVINVILIIISILAILYLNILTFI